MAARWLRWSQRPRNLRRRSAAARLLRLYVRIPPEAWMFVCLDCCVLPGRGLCHELITRPEESCRMWCVVVCDVETSWMRRPWPTEGCRAKKVAQEFFRQPFTAESGVQCQANPRGICRGKSRNGTWCPRGYSVFHSKHYSTRTTSSLLHITYKFKALWNNTNLFLNLIFMTRHYTYIRLDIYIYIYIYIYLCL